MNLITNQDLKRTLRERLQGTLPGRDVHRRFAHELSYGRHAGPVSPDARPAAVSVSLYRDGDQWRIPLIIRQRGPSIHAGQVSFPGGGAESEETPIETALRECGEELGWAPADADVVGELSPIFVYASNYIVTPVVTVSSATPQWQPNDQEVAELLEVPASEILASQAETSAWIQRQSVRFAARCFRWRDYDVWGATAMVLAELKAVLQ